MLTRIKRNTLCLGSKNVSSWSQESGQNPRAVAKTPQKQTIFIELPAVLTVGMDFFGSGNQCTPPPRHTGERHASACRYGAIPSSGVTCEDLRFYRSADGTSFAGASGYYFVKGGNVQFILGKTGIRGSSCGAPHHASRFSATVPFGDVFTS